MHFQYYSKYRVTFFGTQWFSIINSHRIIPVYHAQLGSIISGYFLCHLGGVGGGGVKALYVAKARYPSVTNWPGALGGLASEITGCHSCVWVPVPQVTNA